jgi:tetraacyldisaccharide 4'-kinase
MTSPAEQPSTRGGNQPAASGSNHLAPASSEFRASASSEFRASAGNRLRALVSGERRGLFPSIARAMLSCAALGYRVAVAIRNFAYDRGWAHTHSADVPVISIGNLTVGGTGKTPLVRYVARLLRGQGLRVALLSRGYAARPGDESDEAMELARGLPDVPHLQQPDRVASAKVAVEELESEVLLMDDGFQHRRLKRDLDIVVIDATSPFGFDRLLPRGLLREPIRSLRRADLAILSRVDAVSPRTLETIEARVRRAAPDIPIAKSIHRPTELLGWPDQTLPITALQDRPVAVLSGIGNPAAFVDTVRHAGARVVDVLSLKDHERYDAESMRQIRDWLDRIADRQAAIVCTHKDLVKLKTDRIAGRELWALLVELEIVSGEADVQRLILGVLPRDNESQGDEADHDQAG